MGPYSQRFLDPFRYIFEAHIYLMNSTVLLIWWKETSAQAMGAKFPSSFPRNINLDKEHAQSLAPSNVNKHAKHRHH